MREKLHHNFWLIRDCPAPPQSPGRFYSDKPSDTLAEFQYGFRKRKLKKKNFHPLLQFFRPELRLKDGPAPRKEVSVMITLESAAPGTSTPCQKLSVPNKTESMFSLNFSSITVRGVPLSLNITFKTQFIEKVFELPGYFMHQFRIGKRHKGFAVGLPNEVGYPVDQGVTIRCVARKSQAFC